MKTIAKDSKMQRREFSRITLESKVFVNFKESIIISGEMKNLSLSGAYIKTEVKAPVNEAGEIDILFTEGSPRILLRLKGTVVRRDENGMGINFEKMDLGTFVHLRNTLATDLGKNLVLTEFIDYAQQHSHVAV
jgi:hypothetical protein